MGYLFFYLFTMAIGMFQFGWCVVSFNTLSAITSYRFGWGPDNH